MFSLFRYLSQGCYVLRAVRLFFIPAAEVGRGCVFGTVCWPFVCFSVCLSGGLRKKTTGWNFLKLGGNV